MEEAFSQHFLQVYVSQVHRASGPGDGEPKQNDFFSCAFKTLCLQLEQSRQWHGIVCLLPGVSVWVGRSVGVRTASARQGERVLSVRSRSTDLVVGISREATTNFDQVAGTSPMYSLMVSPPSRWLHLKSVDVSSSKWQTNSEARRSRLNFQIF